MSGEGGESDRLKNVFVNIAESPLNMRILVTVLIEHRQRFQNISDDESRFLHASVQNRKMGRRKGLEEGADLGGNGAPHDERQIKITLCVEIEADIMHFLGLQIPFPPRSGR